MTAWMASIAIAVLSILLCIYRYTFNLERQLGVCTANLQTAIKQKKRTNAHKHIKHIYSIMGTCIASNNSALAYKSIDVLKIAFGEGFARQNEAVVLKNSVIAAMRNKSFQIAEYLLDAFKPLDRTNVNRLPIIEQMCLIGIVAFKERQQFILTKSMDVILECLKKNATEEEFNAGQAALKTLGVLAIKREDIALFRELVVQLLPILSRHGSNNETIAMLSAWLHGIVRQHNEELLDIMLMLTSTLIPTCSGSSLKLLLNEWKVQTSAACLNPDINLGVKLVCQMMQIVCTQESRELWSFISNSIGNIAKVTLDTHGSNKALEVLYPLLDAGRRLLTSELKLSKSECRDECRQQDLFILTKEILIFIEYWARREASFSVGDLILKINAWWISTGKNSPISVDKYIQLLLLYWYRTQKRKAKRGMPVTIEVSSLLTAGEREQLNFL